MRACVPTVWLALVAAVSVAVAAQGPLVTLERASALKASYPFVRFSTLAGFDVPASTGFDGAPLPHPVASAPSASLAIPPEVVALHGKPASVRGYMLPVDVNAEGVKTFILTSTIDSCHWGMTGQPHEWILVEMAEDRRVPFVKFQPVTVFGRLAVEPIWRGAHLAGLYQIRADYLSADGL
jgi:hypothetical protein